VVYAVNEAFVRVARARYWELLLALGLEELEAEEERRGVEAGSVRWKESVGCETGSVVIVDGGGDGLVVVVLRF
jgi:hypothetical protein